MNNTNLAGGVLTRSEMNDFAAGMDSQFRRFLAGVTCPACGGPVRIQDCYIDGRGCLPFYKCDCEATEYGGVVTVPCEWVAPYDCTDFERFLSPGPYVPFGIDLDVDGSTLT